MTTNELIAALKEATGPSRDLDRQIGLLLHPEARLWTPEWWSGGPNEYLRWPDPSPGVARYEQLPRYTASIDLAITLMPDGWEWSLFSEDGTEKPCAILGVIGKNPIEVPWIESHAATPALAMCLACLKARMRVVA